MIKEKIEENKPGILVVNEIFYSIQGESRHAGRPCVFIRLTYCNLRCSYCDTEYAFYEGREYTLEQILKIVKGFRCKLVEVTGGEPLLQSNVHKLLTRLCNEEYEVLLETGGSLDISKVDQRVKRIVDFKCPSSNMVDKNLWDNIAYLKKDDEVKFVIGDRVDYEWSKQMIQKYQIHQRCPVLMSVVFDQLEPIHLAEWVLEDKLDVQFQLQIHKYIWSHDVKSV